LSSPLETVYRELGRRPPGEGEVFGIGTERSNPVLAYTRAECVDQGTRGQMPYLCLLRLRGRRREFCVEAETNPHNRIGVAGKFVLV
jgi:hypothetical protein